jgi:hypothetical protein
VALTTIQLTDGLCSSACSLFVDLMTQQTGVRTVVVGGRPEPGAMQAVSGTRGAALYSGDSLDIDINTAVSMNETAQASLPLRGDLTDSGMVVTWAGFNLRDQVAKNATLPNQMRYLPANCRIYWTFSNFDNYTRLWHDVHTAMYEDNSLCVPSSTNATTSSISKRASDPPHKINPSAQQGQISPYILTGLTGNLPSALDPGVSAGPKTSAQGFPTQCGTTAPNSKLCSPDTTCLPIKVSCKQCTTSRTGASKCPASTISEYRCLSECKQGIQNSGNCVLGTSCGRGVQLNSRANASGSGTGHRGAVEKTVTSGHCYPDSDTSQKCQQVRSTWDLYTSADGGGSGQGFVPTRRVSRIPAS